MLTVTYRRGSETTPPELAATDADEDMAFALVMADRQWGGAGSLDRSYLDYARELIDDIWTYEIADELEQIADAQAPKNAEMLATCCAASSFRCAGT